MYSKADESELIMCYNFCISALVGNDVNAKADASTEILGAEIVIFRPLPKVLTTTVLPLSYHHPPHLLLQPSFVLHYIK